MKKSELKKLIIQCLRENKNEYETDYVEYVRDLKGEEPFLMGNKKYQYVLAKYPSGKLDIGVYAFSGDVVYGYDYFRRMYNIRESLNEVPDPKKHVFFAVDSVDLSVGSRDPDAEREIVYQIFRVTTDTMGDEYESVPVGGRDYYRKEDAQKVADELNQKIGHKLVKEDVEHFSKSTNGTVNVDGIDFDYEAIVSGNVVGMRQPHGEFHSEIDETSVDVEIENITPEPTDEQSKKIDSAVYDDVMGKNLWDLVNEIQSFTMPKPEVKPEKTINITGKKCIRCKKGTYGETSIHNDIEGTKSCSSCGHTLPTNSTKNDLLKEIDTENQLNQKVEIVFELIMDNFFEENSHLKADDMVFWAIQSIGSYNKHKLVKLDRFGEKRIFKFEATLDNTDQVKRVVDLLNSEHHVKKIVVLSIKNV